MATPSPLLAHPSLARTQPHLFESSREEEVGVSRTAAILVRDTRRAVASTRKVWARGQARALLMGAHEREDHDALPRFPPARFLTPPRRLHGEPRRLLVGGLQRCVRRRHVRQRRLGHPDVRARRRARKRDLPLRARRRLPRTLPARRGRRNDARRCAGRDGQRRARQSHVRRRSRRRRPRHRRAHRSPLSPAAATTANGSRS